MKELKKICVLMSTYNGDKYIAEQVNSILNQKDVYLHLVIRDDMSTDKTIEYLKSIEKDERISVIFGNKNFGPAISFMKLLYEVSDYDYYAFADQDDIWEENKLIEAIKKIENYCEPALYCSNQTILIDNKVEGLRYINKPNISLVNIIFGNHVAGCTMVMNRLLRNIICEEDKKPSENVLKIRMHDVWIILVAKAIGKVEYDDKSYIKYRIHSNNVVGIKNDLKDRIKKFKQKLSNPSLKNGRSKIAKELLYKFDLKAKDRTVVNQIANYRENIKIKIKLLFNKDIYANIDEKGFMFVCKVLLNWL